VSETENISKIAELASSDIFNILGWKRTGVKNTNWLCVDQKKHARLKAKTHPSDVVYNYFDPYIGQQVYINTDLKSYAKGTMAAADFSKALKNLGNSVECAKKSADWKQLFVDTPNNWTAYGLLFIYNHDNLFDKDFSDFFDKVTPGKVAIPKDCKVFVIGPDRISYLLAVSHDILNQRGRGLLPGVEGCSFVYPNLIGHHAAPYDCRAATLELLLSPWMILNFEISAKVGGRRGRIVYYTGLTEIDDFKYLLDYLFKYQLVSESVPIEIRCIGAEKNAAANFAAAT
jgi:hypothetical protein